MTTTRFNMKPAQSFLLNLSVNYFILTVTWPRRRCPVNIKNYVYITELNKNNTNTILTKNRKDTYKNSQNSTPSLLKNPK